MIELNKSNVASYVASRLDFFNIDSNVTVSSVGEGSIEEDGDGFINYVFRVSDGVHHLIVKQSRTNTRSGHDIRIDPNRYKLEYRAMQIRKAIVADLLPDLYDCDDENRVIIIEDVSRLHISRFQLMKGITFPALADHMARYMAATEFYTSEYYLESAPYRELGVYFTNTTMRKIMDVGMFLTSVVPEDTVGHQLDPDFARFSKRVAGHPDVLLARQKLRHLFGELLAEIQRVKSTGDFKGAQALVESYGVKIDPELHKEILDRYAKLNIAPYKGFINPVYTAVRDAQGNITDVKISYTEGYAEQMLRYSKDYATLPLVNE